MLIKWHIFKLWFLIDLWMVMVWFDFYFIYCRHKRLLSILRLINILVFHTYIFLEIHHALSNFIGDLRTLWHATVLILGLPQNCYSKERECTSYLQSLKIIMLLTDSVVTYHVIMNSILQWSFVFLDLHWKLLQTCEEDFVARFWCFDAF